MIPYFDRDIFARLGTKVEERPFDFWILRFSVERCENQDRQKPGRKVTSFTLLPAFRQADKHFFQQ